MRPTTLKSVAYDGATIWIYCDDCHREKWLYPLSLPLSPNTPMPSVARRLKCSQCGSRRISAGPIYTDEKKYFITSALPHSVSRLAYVRRSLSSTRHGDIRSAHELD